MKILTRIKTLSMPLFLLVIFVGCGNAPGVPTGTEVHIVYTSNLNGALSDCDCGGTLVGGLTRTLTLIDSLRQRHPDLILADAGDALLSYPLPEANETMLALLALAKYDAMNIGDQELVESPGFIFRDSVIGGNKRPYLSSNLLRKMDDARLAPPSRTVSAGIVAVHFDARIDPGTFSFINWPELRIAGAPVEVDASEGLSEGLQVLLFHGSPAAAEALLLADNRWDVVLLGHNQVQLQSEQNGTIFLETGVDGEYLGHLTARKTVDGWAFENEFIPVLENVPHHPLAKKVVDDYYAKLLE